ncbi:helix-turn-helix domain-containing protein [Nocardia farcinica]|nr:helix-turn-helix domain-containing protein [Nocardia farcinica]MBF6420852.1 helix-turn-helix domain-containing protein [Nocardia farcinica]MBF6432689.1 helix-turn-helix domain-containing protein [Nocardia farcinica]MBF6503188.1 helix-turn-helix domain-containing protein [Nocardia farcinica]
MREYLTTREVAEATGIPEGTWRYWRHLGIGPASFRMGRKKVVYRRSALTEWIAEQEKATARGGDSDVA